MKLANVSGDVDLTTASGRMIARIKGAVARQEAERIGERVARQKQQRAEMGRALGSRFRTFGRTRTFDIVEDEAEVVRELFQRAAAGEALQSLAKELNARGVPTSAGGPWRRTTVANLIQNPGYAGLARYRGQIVGKAGYPPVVTEAQWRAAQHPAKGPGFRSRQYLLSGIAVCALCHGGLYGTRQSGGRYACRIDRPGGCGRVTIKGAWLDTAMLIALSAKLHDEVQRGEHEPDRDYEAELGEVDRRIGELRQAHAAGELELADLLPMLKAERARRAELERQEAAEAVERSTLELAGEKLEDLLSAPVSALRAHLGRYWQAVVVSPTTSAGRRRFDPERIQLVWTDGRVTPWQFAMPPEAFDAVTGMLAATISAGRTEQD